MKNPGGLHPFAFRLPFWF